ncbi:hypothetical protein Tco_0196307 [Tanacetum coccineum]
MAVGCTRDILRQSDYLDWLSEIPWVVPTFVVIEGEDIIVEFCGPSRWKELSKESGSKILPCSDGFYWKTFKPIASLIAKGKLKQMHTRSFLIFTVKVKDIKKVNERVYAAQVGCESCNRPHYTKDFPLKEEGKTFEEAYYTQFGVSFPQGGRYRAAALGFYQRDSRNPLYQERRQTMEKSLTKFMAGSAKRHDENSNLIK